MLSLILIISVLTNLRVRGFGFSLPVRVTGRDLSLLHAAKSKVSFISPLLEQGYAPAVDEYRSKSLQNKPLLLYLPGFDGTLVAPFMQFPELGTEFDVRGMSVDMEDRSSLEDLIELVVDYIHESIESGNGRDRPIYIMGESFGGILALEVVTAIKQRNLRNTLSPKTINLKGLVLINPATCYDQSQLAKDAPALTRVASIIYPFALLTLIPLFTDNYALPQLLLILQSKGLPSVIDSPQREAYMGRTAISLPFVLKFMTQGTLNWRLTEWLERGCNSIKEKEVDVKRLLRNFPVLIVAGEDDKTLPSVMEAKRLSSKLLERSKIHIVPGAGHACTSGSRVDLTYLMRDWFQLQSKGRLRMKSTAEESSDEYFGMEPRYDGANVGLSPLLYWSRDYYQEIKI